MPTVRPLPEKYRSPFTRRVTVSSYFLNVVPEDRYRLGLSESQKFLAFGYYSVPERYAEFVTPTTGIQYELQVEQRHTYYFRQEVDRGAFMDSVLDGVLAEVYRSGIVTVLVDVDDGNVHLGRFSHTIPPDIPVPTDEPLLDEPQFMQFLEKLIPDCGYVEGDPHLRLTP